MASSNKRLPLTLYVEVTAADGTKYRWDANQAPGSRLRNASFSTKIGEGFSTGQGQLARRIDLDYPDLSLVDNVTFIGADGSVAFEGRTSALPRELSDTQSIGVTLTGWMAHAKDKKFSEIYVDRDLRGWGEMPTRRRFQLLGTNFQPVSPTQSPDVDNQAAIETATADTWVSPYIPTSEAWYDAGHGLTIGAVTYTYTKVGTLAGVSAAPWIVTVGLSGNGESVAEDHGNLIAGASPYTNTYTAVAATNRWALLQMYYNGTPAGTAGARYPLSWTKLAVYGRSGVSRYTGEAGEPQGVIASDVIKNIANRWCPHLDTSGVQTSNYVIQHLAFKDRVFPYDAFLDINKYHLWFLGVWENKTLHFRPYDLTDYTWEVRTDGPEGAKFTSQGPAVDDLCGGVAVTYTDILTGITNVLTPDDYPEQLQSGQPENPWIKHGVDNWAEITLSTPSTLTQALELGRAALADRNTPKTPGTISVNGYIRDRQGIEQPAWKVRAGDTISITNFPNDTPRLIVETSWDDESKTLTMSIDRPFALVDAYLDRLSNAVGARNLS